VIENDWRCFNANVTRNGSAGSVFYRFRIIATRSPGVIFCHLALRLMGKVVNFGFQSAIPSFDKDSRTNSHLTVGKAGRSKKIAEEYPYG